MTGQKKNDKKMTEKWQKNDRAKSQHKRKPTNKWQKNDKKMTELNNRTKENDRIKWQKKWQKNDKLNILMYPSVWLQVPSKYIHIYIYVLYIYMILIVLKILRPHLAQFPVTPTIPVQMLKTPHNFQPKNLAWFHHSFQTNSDSV